MHFAEDRELIEIQTTTDHGMTSTTDISTIKSISARLRKHHRRGGMKDCKIMGKEYLLGDFALCFQRSYTCGNPTAWPPK